MRIPNIIGSISMIAQDALVVGGIYWPLKKDNANVNAYKLA